MDENEFTPDEAEKINQWGRKTLAEASVNEAPRILAWCPKCKALVDDECDNAGHPVIWYHKEVRLEQQVNPGHSA